MVKKIEKNFGLGNLKVCCGGFMACRYKTPQKTLPIAAGFLECRYSSVIAAKASILQWFYVPLL